MKFDVWKDIVSQSSHLKSRPDPVKLRGVGGGGPEIFENAWSEGIGVDIGGKNNHNS